MDAGEEKVVGQALVSYAWECDRSVQLDSE